MGRDSKIAWTHHTFNPWWGKVELPVLDGRQWEEYPAGAQL